MVLPVAMRVCDMQHKDTAHDNAPAKLAAAWYCNTKNSPTVAMPGSTLVQGFRHRIVTGREDTVNQSVLFL